MSQTHSTSTRRRFGMSRVCRIWGVPRATVYRPRGPAAGAGTANAPRQPRRRGPQGACSDAELLLHIQAVIAASPFSGKGYRKVWARLRAQGVRTAPRRVRRVMKANDLLAPQRPVQRDAHARMLEWYGRPFDPEDIDERRLHMIINDLAARRRGPLKSHRTGKRPWQQ